MYVHRTLSHLCPFWSFTILPTVTRVESLLPPLYFTGTCRDPSHNRKFKAALPVFGEGDGTPLQYSRLENPMDGGAWQAAVHGVAKSQT